MASVATLQFPNLVAASLEEFVSNKRQDEDVGRDCLILYNRCTKPQRRAS